MTILIILILFRVPDRGETTHTACCVWCSKMRWHVYGAGWRDWHDQEVCAYA